MPGAGPPRGLGQVDEPARDSRFLVVAKWHELADFPPGDPRRRTEFFHRQMNEEIDSLECAARNLTDFPEAPWALRLNLARQCADEARHAVMFRRAYERRGGRIGGFPIINFQYRIVTSLTTLPGRLAVQNRSFEAGGLDAIAFEISNARQDGDDDALSLFDAQMCDEISHVRFANEWIREFGKRNPRVLLEIGEAMTRGAELFADLIGDQGAAGATYPADQQARLEAGFSLDEVALASELAARLRA
jgi:uncharacterized ferritin-like protein (DUF455 family)